MGTGKEGEAVSPGSAGMARRQAGDRRAGCSPPATASMCGVLAAWSGVLPHSPGMLTSPMPSISTKATLAGGPGGAWPPAPPAAIVGL